MERRTVSRVARGDAIGRAARGVPRVRLGLGAVGGTRAGTAAFAATVALATATGAVFVAFAVVRWRSFETNAFDLAFFDQIIWNSARGRIFETSFVRYNFAGQHLEPVLLAFVPAYWLGGGPVTLMAVQGAMAASAAVPLHVAARRFGLGPWMAFAAAAAYLANPYLHRAIAFDFHPEVMVALPAFAAAAAIASGRARAAVACALATLAFKEDAVFVALALAGLMAVRGMRRPAAWTAGAAVTWALMAVLVVMPLARDGHSSDLIERYGYLGGGRDGLALVVAVALHPSRPLLELAEPARLASVALFVAVSAPLAAARPRYLVAIVPGAALALLSSHPEQRALELHYAAELVPLALLAAVVAASDLRARAPGFALGAAMLAPAVIGLGLLRPFGEAHGTPPTAAHRAAVEAAIAMVPRDGDVGVSAQSGLLPRVAQRERAWEFPNGLAQAEYTLVDRYGFRSGQSLAAGFDDALAEVRTSHERIFAEDGVELFRRTP